ncbi:MAG TPA: hypothetical protein VF702_14545 [Allosphingosinicella sp.]
MIPFLGTLPHSSLPHLSELHWIDALVGVASLPLTVVLPGYPQVFMAFIMRSLESALARMIGALASFVLALWYAIWAAGADLSGSSTAPVALVFYQIMVQGWAWLAALATMLVVARLDSDGAR